MNGEEKNKEDLKIPGIDSDRIRSGPFKAPEGYFENLTPRMMDAVRESQQKETQGLTNLLSVKVLAPTFGAAMVAVIAFLALQNNVHPDLDTQFAELAADLQIEQVMLLDEVMSLDLVEAELVNLDLLEDDEVDITEYLLENEIELSTLVDEITL